jgi:hypothetical protein
VADDALLESHPAPKGRGACAGGADTDIPVLLALPL